MDGSLLALDHHCLKPQLFGLSTVPLHPNHDSPITPTTTTTTTPQAGITSGALASAAVGATNVLGTLIATGLIERAGRKQLLLQSYGGMAAAMLLMAAGFVVPALAPYSGACFVTCFVSSGWASGGSCVCLVRGRLRGAHLFAPAALGGAVCSADPRLANAPPSPSTQRPSRQHPCCHRTPAAARPHRPRRHAVLHPELCHRRGPSERTDRARAERRARAR